MLTHQDLDKADNYATTKSKEYSESIDSALAAKARAVVFSKQEKDLLAVLILKMDGSSFLQREAMARASDEWREFRMGQEVVIKDEAKQDAIMQARKEEARDSERHFNAMQSKLSYQKEELKRGILS